MTTAAIDPRVELQQVLRAIPRPRPLLDRERERGLSERQRELLSRLQRLFFADGFAQLTMSDLAAQLRCSLRTLYVLAPTRDELVLIVVDRNLWRVGQAAHDAIDPATSALRALRGYLHAATFAVSEWTEPFVRDLAAVPAAQALADGHRTYLFEVTRALLDLANRRGEIVAADTAAVARVMAGLGGFFSRPEVIATLRSTPKQAADEVLELILRGMEGRSR